jgi:hypothetical protein
MAREFLTPVDLRGDLLIGGSSGATGQVPTRQADGSIAWQTPAGGSASLARRIDASATTTIYNGRAAAGTAENATGWTIIKTTFSAFGAKLTEGTASGAWTNRASLTYS